MIKNGVQLDGIEVSYSSFTREQKYLLEMFCIENRLKMSGGSDFHGKKRPKNILGYGADGMRISTEYLKDWPIDYLYNKKGEFCHEKD